MVKSKTEIVAITGWSDGGLVSAKEPAAGLAGYRRFNFRAQGQTETPGWFEILAKELKKSRGEALDDGKQALKAIYTKTPMTLILEVDTKYIINKLPAGYKGWMVKDKVSSPGGLFQACTG